MKRLTMLAAVMLAAGVSAQSCESQLTALKAKYPDNILLGGGVNAWGLGNGLVEQVSNSPANPSFGQLATFNETVSGTYKFDVTNGFLYKKVFLNQGDGIPAGLCSNITTMRNEILALFSNTGLCNTTAYPQGPTVGDGLPAYYSTIKSMVGLTSDDGAWKIFNFICPTGW